MRLTINVDLDGVVYDFPTVMLEHIGNLYPNALVPTSSEVQGWDMWSYISIDGAPMTEGQFMDAMVDGILKGIIFNEGPIYPGAVQALAKLKEDGHFIRIVTSKAFDDVEVRHKAIDNVVLKLERHNISYDEICFVKGAKTDFRADVVIDDNPMTSVWAQPNALNIIFRQPWNVDAERDEDCYFLVTDDWDEIPSLVGPPPMGKEVGRLMGEVRTVSSSGGEKGVKPAQFDQFPVAALLQIAEVFGYGAHKYSAHNFRRGYEWSKSFSAMQRHLWAFWGGETTDSESRLPHLAHAAWHCMTLMSFVEEHPEFDDRYRP